MSDKPREFWIAGNSKGWFEAFEQPCGDYSDWYRAVSVIEKAPVLAKIKELEAEIDRLKEFEWKYKELCK